jgi:hypothetical protein
MEWSEFGTAQPRLAARGRERLIEPGWQPEPGRFHLFAVELIEVSFLRYDDATGDQFVTQWPPAREFVRRGTTATSLGAPEPLADLIA